MNYYEHHIGDYAEATSHLSFVEDAAYSRLIRKYYSTERPLPADTRAAQRLVAARTREEKAAVVSVLEEFFELRDDGWHNTRCDEDIAKYQAGAPEREAKRAHEEARLKRHRAERTAMFEALRARGHTPNWNVSIAELRALHERFCNAPATPPATGVETLPATAPATAPATPATATQTPDTRHQTPDTNPNPVGGEGRTSAPTDGAGRERRAGRASRIPDDFALTPERRQVAETEGVSPERTFARFCDYWRAASGANARKLDWDATWRNWCRREADDLAKRSRSSATTHPYVRPKTAEELEAMEAARATG